jgi:AraC-like DNA-binding protein
MLKHKLSPSPGLQRQAGQNQRQQFDALCRWIEAHIDEPIGWIQLIDHSGLEYQKIQKLFFDFESTTPMTWIRQRRMANSSSSTA